MLYAQAKVIVSLHKTCWKGETLISQGYQPYSQTSTSSFILRKYLLISHVFYLRKMSQQKWHHLTFWWKNQLGADNSRAKGSSYLLRAMRPITKIITPTTKATARISAMAMSEMKRKSTLIRKTRKCLKGHKEVDCPGCPSIAWFTSFLRHTIRVQHGKVCFKHVDLLYLLLSNHDFYNIQPAFVVQVLLHNTILNIIV